MAKYLTLDHNNQLLMVYGAINVSIREEYECEGGFSGLQVLQAYSVMDRARETKT